MRRTVAFGVAVAGAAWAAVAGAQEVLTARKVIRNMQEALAAVQTYRADVRITVEEGKRKTVMEGKVLMRRPDRLLIRFSQPADQVIYSDGRVMKVYLPQVRVVAEQRFPQAGGGQEVLLAGSGGGFQQLLRQYNWSYAEKDIQKVGGKRYHVVRLQQKNVYSGFRTVDLWVSENWLIVKAVGTTREGRVVTVTFSDIALNTPTTDAEFALDLPIDVQTVYDPFVRPENR